MGLKSEGLDPSLTIVKRDNDGCSWPVLLGELLYECVIFDILMGLGLVEKVGPAKEMLSSLFPP